MLFRSDRFGDPPKSVINLLKIAQLKAKAHRVYIKEVNQKGAVIKLLMHEHADINTAKIPDLVKNYEGRMTFTAAGKNPVFAYNLVKNSRDAKKIDILALLTQMVEMMSQICLSI